MKKRWMTWLGLCLCTALLAGCGKDTGEEQSAKKATESKTKQSVEETTEEVTEEATEEETEVKPTIFQIAEQDIELTPGGEAQLSVKVLPENVDISGVKWTSKNEEVISVDSTGKVTAVKEGKAQGPIYTYGPIIHNEEVVRDLEEKDVQVLDTEEDLENLPEGQGTVIIRSHGVSRHVYDILNSRGVNVVDAVISLPSARTAFPVSLSISVPLTVYSLPGSRFV